MYSKLGSFDYLRVGLGAGTGHAAPDLVQPGDKTITICQINVFLNEILWCLRVGQSAV